MNNSNYNLNVIKYYEHNQHKIKYSFIGKEKSDYLVVILCERKLEDIIKSSKIIDSINTLGNTVLLIDDYINEMPTLYLGVNGKETLLNSISALVNLIMKETGHDVQRLIVCGHGRAGTASLLLGNKVNAKNIISNFPSMYFKKSLEALLEFNENEVLDYIVGNPYNQSEKIIDELLHKKVLKDQRYQSYIYLQGNTIDNSMKDIIKHFDNINQKYFLSKLKEHDNSEAIFLKEFLGEKLKLIKNDSIIDDPIIRYINDNNFSLDLNLSNFDIETMDIALYFYSNKKREMAINYNKALQYNIELNLNTLDNIKIFVKKGNRILDTKRYYI